MKNLYPVKVYSNLEKEITDKLLINSGLQIDVNERNAIELKENDYLMLDFGKEINGSLRILTNLAFGDKKVRIRYGESLMETLSDVGYKGSTNDHSTRDFIDELEHYSDMTFIESGFRFARIDIMPNTQVKIKSIMVRLNIDETPYKYEFKSDNETLNRIFDTAAYTVRLCIQNDVIWDGVKRDRLVWIGDMHPEVTSIMNLFGDKENIKNALEHAKKYNPIPLWMNNIPSYSLWWIIINRDYYYKNGDKEYLEKQLEYLDKLIDQLDLSVNENGKVVFKDSYKEMQYFVDWPTHPLDENDNEYKDNDEYAGIIAIMYWALNAAKEIYDVFNIVNSKIDLILSKLSLNNVNVIKSKQMAALRILNGIYNDNDKKIIKANGAHSISTFMAGYIFKALSLIDEDDLAFDNMIEYYSGMLNIGATTFFEDFDIDWLNNSSRIDEIVKEGKIDIHGDFGNFCYKGYRHSFCHGWSSSVIMHIVDRIVGIKILEPNSKKIEIKPHMSKLKYLHFSYPTPYGNIDIDIKNENGENTIEYIAPKEIEIVL